MQFDVNTRLYEYSIYFMWEFVHILSDVLPVSLFLYWTFGIDDIVVCIPGRRHSHNFVTTLLTIEIEIEISLLTKPGPQEGIYK